MSRARACSLPEGMVGLGLWQEMQVTVPLLINGPLTKAECFWGHCGLGGVWMQSEDAPRA